MRVKRLQKFRKYRHAKVRNLLFMGFLLPVTLLFMGYLVSSLIILPAMK